jgi:phosphatidylglycerol lysyltransferase
MACAAMTSGAEEPPPHTQLAQGSEHRLRHHAASLLLAVLLGAAVWLLHHELRTYQYNDIRRALQAIPSARIGLAILLTAVSYWILTAYDVLALRHLDRRLPYRRTALASFLGYAFAHNVGVSVLGGAAPRYRLYSAWGLSAIEIATVLGFAAVMFWMGSLTIAGLALVIVPRAMAASLRLPTGLAVPLGAAFLAVVAGYLIATAVRTRPLLLRGWEFALPTPVMALRQLMVSTIDWAMVAAVLYVLLPAAAHISYWHFVGLFVVAQVIGVSSHVPGGVGVFETIMLLALGASAQGPAIIGSLLVFRAVYYLLPLVIATGTMAAYEALQRRAWFGDVGAVVARWAPEIAPRVLAVTTFIGGAVLLLSGATPAGHRRLEFFQDVVPLPVLELSHFLGSMVGLGLVLLASAVQRRVGTAYHLAVALLLSGAVLSLLKGLKYEEALVLLVVLGALLPCRRYFYRPASIVGERFTPGWTLAVVLVIASSIWLGFFAYEHHEYSNELWWQFSVSGNAPRFLRASVGVVAGALFFAAAHLLRPARARVSVPDAEVMRVVRELVSRSPQASAHLALLGDKSFVFSDDRRGFIMYALSGRSCVAMGDPVGPADCHAELVWRFRELCDRSDSWPVFYETSAANLPLYLDLGLYPLKFGEEARVSVPEFSIDSSTRKAQRYIIRRIERDGGSFDVLPAEAVPTVLPQLQRISDDWLTAKRAREKGFSLGCFDDQYLCEFPLAVVRVNGTIEAFANLWCSGQQEEISPDLMRHSRGAPPSVMEYLFLKIILWGQRQGYRWCNLSMAPLAGLESRALAPLWHRVGALAYLYGEPFYNFQGLRQFKQKFDPEWRPKYLVCPGGLLVPRVLANVAALVSGGLRGVVAK